MKKNVLLITDSHITAYNPENRDCTQCYKLNALVFVALDKKG